MTDMEKTKIRMVRGVETGSQSWNKVEMCQMTQKTFFMLLMQA